MSKVVVNLYAGPGAGKSTVAAELFALLKQERINAEMCREYIKNWVWEKRQPADGDQLYITAKQSRRELVLCRAGVDVVISDSPILLASIYEREYQGDAPQISGAIYEHHSYYVKKFGYQVLNVFIERHGIYQQEGRYHNFQQAENVDQIIKEELEKRDIQYHTFKRKDAAKEIFKILKAK